MGVILSRWAANENPPGSGRDGEILSLNVVDDRLAVVLFRYTDEYYDSLVLLNTADGWQIVQKAFIQQ